ncbi:MAG TPA: hypothetical protein VMT18_13605 [Planctomycetota bacterium]|nr:hypothetical protein [Planctomycetota bacterium]
MHQLDQDRLAGLLAEQTPPCISLYQRTHRRHPENQQDPIRYRNQLRDVEESLLELYPKRDVKERLLPFQALDGDEIFWNHRTEGLAILASADEFQIIDLQRPVENLVVVADSFHVKPLLRVLQSADRYQILCLNRHEARLYEGNRDALDAVELPNVPSTITEALGTELTEPHLTVASYGKGAGKGGKESYHGHGGKQAEVDIDMERFFRVVDRAILEHHSQTSGLPLMLAALPQYHAPFRKLSDNPYLMEGGIEMATEDLEIDALRRMAWQHVEPLYLQKLTKLVEDFEVARSRDLGSDDLAQVAQAAAAGRIGKLMVEADRQVPGRWDAQSGRFEPGDLAHGEVDDVLDDLAEAVLRRKGEVVIVPTARMPSDTGLAAIYRY